MDESGDDLLARAGLTGYQHGRVRLCDLGRLLQHVPPFRGFADDADLRFRVELLESICTRAFEPLGAGLRLGGLSFRLDELLVRDRERDVIRDPTCRRQIARRERSRPFRPEGQVDDLLTGRDSHAQEGAIPGRDHRRERVRGVEDRQQLGADVGDDEFIGPGGLDRDRQGIGEVGRRRCLAHEVTVPIDEDHGQCVVRQHLVGKRRDLRKHRADVEDV